VLLLKSARASWLSRCGRASFAQAEQLWRRIELDACDANLMPSSPDDAEAPCAAAGGGGEGARSGFSRATPFRKADLAADVALRAWPAGDTDTEAERVRKFRQFWEADAIWASPLTRAVQTALIGLQGHPTMRME